MVLDGPWRALYRGFDSPEPHCLEGYCSEGFRWDDGENVSTVAGFVLLKHEGCVLRVTVITDISTYLSGQFTVIVGLARGLVRDRCRFVQQLKNLAVKGNWLSFVIGQRTNLPCGTQTMPLRREQ